MEVALLSDVINQKRSASVTTKILKLVWPKRSKNSKFNQPQTVLLRVPAKATNESVVPWIGDGAAFTLLIHSSSLAALQQSLDMGLFLTLTWWWLERLCACDVWSSCYPSGSWGHKYLTGWSRKWNGSAKWHKKSAVDDQIFLKWVLKAKVRSKISQPETTSG